jgi:hypothetical protein
MQTRLDSPAALMFTAALPTAAVTCAAQPSFRILTGIVLARRRRPLRRGP